MRFEAGTRTARKGEHMVLPIEQLLRDGQPKATRRAGDNGEVHRCFRFRLSSGRGGDQISRHPLDDARRTSETPQEPEFSAALERLWPDRFTLSKRKCGLKDDDPQPLPAFQPTRHRVSSPTLFSASHAGASRATE